MDQSDYSRLAAELIAAAHDAGARILDHYGNAEVEFKDDASPVTVADRAADAVLVDALRRIAPDIPVISEESSPSQKIAVDGEFFLVDPLDGTKEFIHGRDEFTVNVALIDHRVPRFGIVYAPALGQAFVTRAPDEAVKLELDARAPLPDINELEFSPIATRAADPGNLVAAVSRSHMDDDTAAFLAEHGINDTHVSGSSLKFCCIAEGLADVYPRFGRTMEWDTAAGHAVLAAAGGTVLDEAGAPFTYGKHGQAYANPGFVAWGSSALAAG
ncbi:MAG: 3'(2'),5'-bisphosphate nucleotidase CysQ [Hyphomicrobiaceae bacterium]|nr:3'(2'),5'-bisphosphate nucleotidase CysQ [Hyphomicrobiaceae bacterium]